MSTQFYLVTYLKSERRHKDVYLHLITAKSKPHAAAFAKLNCRRSNFKVLRFEHVTPDTAAKYDHFETPHKVGRI